MFIIVIIPAYVCPTAWKECMKVVTAVDPSRIWGSETSHTHFAFLWRLLECIKIGFKQFYVLLAPSIVIICNFIEPCAAFLTIFHFFFVVGIYLNFVRKTGLSGFKLFSITFLTKINLYYIYLPNKLYIRQQDHSFSLSPLLAVKHLK